MDSVLPLVSEHPPIPTVYGVPHLNPNASSDSKVIDQVATQFEAVFASQLLKEMRKTLEPGVLFGADSGDVYGGLFDLFIGQYIADEGGGFGIAKMVAEYLHSRPS